MLIGKDKFMKAIATVKGWVVGTEEKPVKKRVAKKTTKKRKPQAKKLKKEKKEEELPNAKDLIKDIEDELFGKTK